MDNAINNNNNSHDIDELESKDEVDFVNVSTNNNYYNISNINNKLTELKPISGDNSCSNNNSSNNSNKTNSHPVNDSSALKSPTQNAVPSNKEPSSKKKKTDVPINDKKATTRERLSLFSFNKKISQKHNSLASKDAKIGTAKPTNTSKVKSKGNVDAEGFMVKPSSTIPASEASPLPIVRQHKFVKSSSISRLLGNTYNAKKFEKEEQKRLANDGKFNTYAGRRRLSGPYLERFRQCSKEDGDDVVSDATMDFRDLYGGSSSDLVSSECPQGERPVDFGVKAMRTLSRGLGKLWWRKSHSVDISIPDPEFKVTYLGNVLTGWAKGEGCVEKQLNTLWRNYTQNSKPDVIMRIKVCASGLKATTRQHGLTEYWSNRITHCCAPKNYPRVFCWIYRHEGRKLKHELRCHAVLCSKEKIVQDICSTLKENLESALREFKRDKILKQNARLSLANAAYENPSLPRRKILLSVGGNNYRPPLERSKSAPKLMSIEEAIGEEDGEEIEETNEPEMKSCCQKDSLYPAMTLGRRHCRRGHSIRRTGKTRPSFCSHFVDRPPVLAKVEATHDVCCNSAHTKDNKVESLVEEQRHSYGSDDSDDFDKLLKYNNYDSASPLANELLPYFDLQLHKKTSSSLSSLSELKHEEEPLSLLPTINSDPSADPDAEFRLDVDNELEQEPVVVGLRRDGVCSDGEDDYLDADDMYFRQASILNMLHRNSMRKMATLSLSSDESSIETNASLPMQFNHQVQSSISSNASSTATSVSAAEAARQATGKQLSQSMDSDEGSISSGCETASTVTTANQDDISLRYRHSKQLNCSEESADLRLNPALPEEEDAMTVDEIYQRLESRLHGRHGSDATTFSSSSSITLKMGASPTSSMKEIEGNASARSRKVRRQASTQCEQSGDADSDSECSDESGYVEYQERGSIAKAKMNQPPTKPQPPPKPMPRRHIGTGATTAI